MCGDGGERRRRGGFITSIVSSICSVEWVAVISVMREGREENLSEQNSIMCDAEFRSRPIANGQI